MGGANYMCLCSMEFPFFSRKLAVASWSYSCFSKGRGRSESNSDFSFEPPRAPGHFEAVSEADGHGLKSCQVSRQSVFNISKSHLVSRLIRTLAFVPPPGPQVPRPQLEEQYTSNLGSICADVFRYLHQQDPGFSWIFDLDHGMIPRLILTKRVVDPTLLSSSRFYSTNFQLIHQFEKSCPFKGLIYN